MRRTIFSNISPATRQALLHAATAFVMGLALFWALYNRYPLYTSHVDWAYIAGGDAFHHQMGWEWFRQEPWRFPLGSIQAYGYPVGTSVAFMDSIPLFAFLFKLLSPWLEPQFQYFGLWELSAVMGQALLGLLILGEFTRSYRLKILGAALLVLSPPMIFRAFYHSSLSAHWILLAGIWFVLLERRGALRRGAWAALFALAALIHLYFIPLLLPLWWVGASMSYRRERRARALIVELAASAALVGLIGYGIGLFSLPTSSLAAEGFGVFSWNLNGFFNPFKFASAYIKEIPTGKSGQYEGFSYLGLGVLMLLPGAVYTALRGGVFQRNWREMAPFAAAAAAYTLYALSTEAYAGTLPLWNIPLPEGVEQFFNLFRASGRFIWPVFYFIVLFVLVMMIRRVKWAGAVLGLALALQFIDLQPLAAMKRLDGPVRYEQALAGPFWDAAAGASDHVVVTPYGKFTSSHERLVLFAAHHGLTINFGKFMRSDERALKAYAETAWEDLRAGRADARSLYVILDPDRLAAARADLGGRMTFCEADGFAVAVPQGSELLENTAVVKQFCAAP